MPFLTHAWHLLCFLAVVLGPVPLAWLAARRASSASATGLSHVVLVFLIWWCAFQCATGILLGAIGGLRLPILLAVEIGALSAGVVVARRQRAWSQVRSTRSEFGSLLKSATPDSRSELPLLGVLSATALTLAWRAVTTPITEFDSLAYHLPQVAEWYQDGSLVPLTSMRQVARYPFNVEVLQTLLVVPFGEDFVIALPNLCAWVMLGIAVYHLAVCLGASSRLALTAAGLCVMTPDVTFQLRTALVDLAFAAFFVTSLYFTLHMRRSGSTALGPTLLASLGLLLGTKMSGIAYAAIIGLVWTTPGRWWRRHPNGCEPVIESSHRRARPTTLGFALLFWLGGFWYARNWIQIGNPLGYIPVQIGGFELLGGDSFYADLRRTTLAGLFDSGNRADWTVLWQALQAKWQIPFGAFVVQLLLLPVALFVRSSVIPRRRLWLALCLLVVTGALYWNTPFTGDNGGHDWRITGWIANNVRFGMPFLCMMAVSGAVVSTATRFPAEPLIAAVVVACGLTISIAIGVEVIELLLALFAIVWGAWRLQRFYRTPGRLGAQVVWFLVLVGIPVLTFLARIERDANRAQAYGNIQSVVEREVPVGGRVGYLMTHKPYVLYGRRLDRRVYHAPADGRDELEWVLHLREQAIDLLAIEPTHEYVGRSELEWLRDANGAFSHIYGPDEALGMVLFGWRE